MTKESKLAYTGLKNAEIGDWLLTTQGIRIPTHTTQVQSITFTQAMAAKIIGSSKGKP